MKTLKIAIVSASALAFTFLFVYAYRLNSELKKSEENANELRRYVQNSEKTYTLLKEIHDRQDRVICDYEKKLKRLKDEQTRKISIIEESNDACDWLDAPVPVSIGVLFGKDGCERNCPDETTVSSADTM